MAALVPRSSLRSLVLLMSHGKPQLSSFFSSAATAAPQAAPVRPSGSSHGSPLECPNGTSDIPSSCVLKDPEDTSPTLTCALEDSKHDITDDPKSLCNTLEPDADKPMPGATKDPSGPICEGSYTPVIDKPPPPGPRKGPDHRVPETP
ncbi:uncharacterized protein LOC124683766 [Lolium rigidum]|uniref:uncharacterized protein LOC124683766 n=1 Tax=Lolium rigidum TaxID=89674 RepID=UPI001F5C85D2|nr:uncharacterized protein LOC124683766 [Lolium rigidum]